ncbi:RsmB/NOP family class I SAM-dependent RNA methyltransferase [Mesorhizobium sp. YIM 152430]|uniref:RsmB/NOP family class I SAM-dependent RNA methyltransferase n=1 Tax=Mesorhizobium sp. YIM 152430 TaxID=3031761 RepID=UPI0023D9AE9B|nr:RsmB/NOP family class I SAM-dependent RNA methyltransferase [Mesorhizobium sp. YIM 152430]MDF1599389.1 RsmB/NOP family class I SAM-dependent RNA methyltransferase [Mesorhizobium sp. YIM 152430]
MKAARRKPQQTETHDETPGLLARRVAARLLAAVIDTKTSLDGLTDGEHGHPQYRALDARDRGLVRAILTTALRHRMAIQALIDSRLDRKLPSNAAALTHILHVGAAQLLFLDVPDSAAVDLAVTHAKADPRTRRFANLVNAILREIGRRKERALPAVLAKTVEAPDWFAKRLEAAYGQDQARAILDMHRHEAAIDLTVKSNPEGWAEKLGGFVLPTGSVRLTSIDGPVSELAGFAEGEWWVQDAAAALPARLMGDIAGLRVADICAAPGGKTAQLALAGASVVAIEKVPNRAKRLAGNLERLKLEAEIVVSDLFEHKPAKLYDAVLLDAPCSSTGTIRRHPDVLWTKTPEDVARLAGLQRRMLDHAATLVKPGGTILFCNCSLDPEEGEAMIAKALAENRKLERVAFAAGEFPFVDSFLDADGAVRTTPAGLPDADPKRAGLDGFYAVRLRVER